MSVSGPNTDSKSSETVWREQKNDLIHGLFLPIFTHLQVYAMNQDTPKVLAVVLINQQFVFCPEDVETFKGSVDAIDTIFPDQTKDKKGLFTDRCGLALLSLKSSDGSRGHCPTPLRAFLKSSWCNPLTAGVIEPTHPEWASVRWVWRAWWQTLLPGVRSVGTTAVSGKT